MLARHDREHEKFRWPSKKAPIGDGSLDGCRWRTCLDWSRQAPYRQMGDWVFASPDGRQTIVLARDAAKMLRASRCEARRHHQGWGMAFPVRNAPERAAVRT